MKICEDKNGPGTSLKDGVTTTHWGSLLSELGKKATRIAKGWVIEEPPASDKKAVMRLEPKLDLLLSGLVLAFAIPAWVPMLRGTNLWLKLWKPLALVTLSLIIELAFVNSIMFGPFTLDYSLRFAVVGMPLSILAIILVSKRSVGPAAVVW